MSEETKPLKTWKVKLSTGETVDIQWPDDVEKLDIPEKEKMSIMLMIVFSGMAMEDDD